MTTAALFPRAAVDLDGQFGLNGPPAPRRRANRRPSPGQSGPRSGRCPRAAHRRPPHFQARGGLRRFWADRTTTSVGTAPRVAGLVQGMAPAGDLIVVAWNPEFVRESFAVEDTLRPDRLVLGFDTTHSWA
ncbi:hypothetical protein ACFVRD_27640 [Streptomyces sp. NPDC057908]|uniref:hypothetical protein n=1 Tax=Streptomyces sp. NPDC057908 TaxID=3346276 RepID=UPI0036E3ED89